MFVWTRQKFVVAVSGAWRNGRIQIINNSHCFVRMDKVRHTSPRSKTLSANGTYRWRAQSCISSIEDTGLPSTGWTPSLWPPSSPTILYLYLPVSCGVKAVCRGHKKFSFSPVPLSKVYCSNRAEFDNAEPFVQESKNARLCYRACCMPSAIYK